MEELILFIVKNLVTHPDDVLVSPEEKEGNLYLNLTVNPEDMGIVIGKSGQTIRSIRKLLAARAMIEANQQRVFLNLVETK